MKKGIFVIHVLAAVLLGFVPASGAAKDTIVIAQGVDPTTLDPQNHYETPGLQRVAEHL